MSERHRFTHDELYALGEMERLTKENEQLRAFARDCLARIDMFYGDKTSYGTYGLEPIDQIEQKEIHAQAKALGIEVEE